MDARNNCSLIWKPARSWTASARAAFERAAAMVRDGRPMTEYELQTMDARAIPRERAHLRPSRRSRRCNRTTAIRITSRKAIGSRPIRAGDLLLLDIWAKCDRPGSVYYDITWVGYLGARVPEAYAKIFKHRARGARSRRSSLCAKPWRAGKTIHGWEVDHAAREVIRKAGYAKYFVHRTGHSIGQEVHGNGANMDGLETRDDRQDRAAHLLFRRAWHLYAGIRHPQRGECVRGRA